MNETPKEGYDNDDPFLVCTCYRYCSDDTSVALVQRISCKWKQLLEAPENNY